MQVQHIEYESLIAFAANELSSDPAHTVATHIANCVECSNTVRRFKLISALMLADDSREPPPPTLARAQAIFVQQRPARATFWQGFQLPKPMLATRQFARAFVLIAFVLANLIMYGGIGAVAVSAQESIPGDSLYQAKLNIESIQLAVTWDTGDRVQRHITFADSRTSETVALITLERLVEIPNTLGAYEKQVDLVHSTFSVLVKENFKRAQALGSVVEAAMARQITTLGNLHDTAIETLKPALEHAIQIGNARRAEVKALAQTPPTPAPTAPRLGAPTLTRVLGPSGNPSAVPPSVRTATPAPPATKPASGASSVAPTSSAPEKTKTPPGLIRTPTKTPPGLDRSPTPVRAIILPTATSPVEKSKTPPGQIKTPPGLEPTKGSSDRNDKDKKP